MNTSVMRKNISLFIVATLTLLLVIIPVNQIQAAAVVDSINAGQTVAGQTTIGGDILDVGWVYTAGATYTLGRIEAKFAEADTSVSTIEFYTAPPPLGGTLLATGTFTPTALAPAGTNFEGANLSNTVSIVSGNTYFVAFKNIYSSPTSNAAGVALQLYYSLGTNDYSIVGDGVQNGNNRPIIQFFSADPPTITSAAPVDGTQGNAYSHTYTATGNATITYSVTAGALPTGLSLSAAGVISGTPSASGLFTGTVTATNGATPDDTQNFSITITGVAPTITSGAPPTTGTQGVAYNHTYTATGSATITYSVTAGTLPTGLSLSAAGAISGTPTTPGLYTGTVTATNSVAPDATQNFSITIAGVAPTITSGAPPTTGTQGVAYNHTYTATGSATITYSVTAGALPTGLTLSAAGAISGTPTTPGLFTGTVTATNGTAPDATQNFSITIAGVAPTITSGAPPTTGTQGVAYNHTYTATGSATITYSVTAGALPTGLTLSAAGVISGTPTTPGLFTGTVTAANTYTPDATQNFSITIAGVPPTITSGAPPTTGTQGVAYNHTYTATGSATISYSVTTGALPTGLTLSAAGAISGTPTAVGLFTGTVTATNTYAPDATQNFSINITATAVAPTITSGAPGNGTQGNAYNHTYTATGSATITYSVTAGALPTGLTLSAAGAISGTPTTPGLYTGTVTATNGTAPDATQNFSITIAGIPPTITSGAPAAGTQGNAYNHTYTATGSATITYSVTAGALPTGLTLSAAGAISGTPTAVGLFTGTVTATNTYAPDATQNFSINITATAVAPAITSAAPAAGTQGNAYNHTYTATGSATITYSVTAGALPTGLTLSAAGVITGTPTTSGLFTGTVTATNGTAPDATQNFSITINAAGTITLSPTTLPNSTVGAAYSQNITATGGTGPYTFAVTAGTLPTGLTLSAAGAISGTPTVAATFNFTVTATDSLSATGSQAYTVIISAGGTPPVAPVVTHLPEPPPAPACTDTNFETDGMIRTNFTNDADRAGLSCRLMAANGSYLTWLGGPLTDSAMIGNKTVLDLGVVAAADVFSASSKNGFIGDVNICLKGSGYMIYMNANSSPRVPQLWSAWTTPAFPGYTCTTLYAPGTVILVSHKPS